MLVRQRDDFPKWLQPPFDEFSKSSWDTLHVWLLYVGALGYIQGSKTKSFELLNSISQYTGTTHGDQVNDRFLGFLNQEMETGHPFVTKLFIGNIWSSLEIFTRQFVAAWLQYLFTARPTHFIDLRLNLDKRKGYLQSRDSVAYWERIAEDLGRSVSIHDHLGPARFDKWVSALRLRDLSSTPWDGIAPNCNYFNCVVEIQLVRNCVIHNRSLADHRLVAHCPWLELTSGQALKFNVNDCYPYSKAAQSYVYDVLVRSYRQLGLGEIMPWHEFVAQL